VAAVVGVSAGVVLALFAARHFGALLRHRLAAIAMLAALAAIHGVALMTFAVLAVLVMALALLLMLGMACMRVSNGNRLGSHGRGDEERDGADYDDLHDGTP
jgi:type III secretory pathway component EscV